MSENKSAIQKAKESIRAKRKKERARIRGEDAERVFVSGSDSLADDPVYSNWVRKIRRGIPFD